MTTPSDKQTDNQPALQPCPICSFHWNTIVFPGQKHNRNCPHLDDQQKGCACHDCGQRYKVDIQVPDDLWNRIKPDDRPYGAGLLCGRCVFSRIEALGEFGALTLARVNGVAATVDEKSATFKAYNQAIEDAKDAIRGEKVDDLYAAATFINAIARKCSPHVYVNRLEAATAPVAAPMKEHRRHVLAGCDEFLCLPELNPHHYEIVPSAAVPSSQSPAIKAAEDPQDDLVDEVQHRMDQVVEAAVEWHQAGREGGEWLDAADNLARAIDSLLELRSQTHK